MQYGKYGVLHTRTVLALRFSGTVVHVWLPYLIYLVLGTEHGSVRSMDTLFLH